MSAEEQHPTRRDPKLDPAYCDAPRGAPQAGVSARMLAAAHRADDARPTWLPRPPVWLERYRVPLALAATIALGVSTTLVVQEHDRSRGEETRDRSRVIPKKEPNATRASESKKEVEQLEPRRISPSPPAAPASPSVPIAREPPDLAPRYIAPRGAEPVPPAAASPPSAVSGPRDEITPPQAAPLARERASTERSDRATRELSPLGEDAWAAVAEMRLSQIRGLRAAGRDSEAAARLKEFVKSFPNHPLPPDLR